MTVALLELGGLRRSDLDGDHRRAVEADERASRERLLGDVDDLLVWHDQVSGCEVYSKRLRALRGAHSAGDVASLVAFVAVGRWPSGREFQVVAPGTPSKDLAVAQGGHPLLLTTRAAAKFLSVDHAFLRTLIDSGELHVVQLGEVRRVPMTALEALVNNLSSATDVRVTPPATSRGEEELMTPREVSAYLTVPVSTLYSWRHEHKGPPAVRVGRHLRWRRRDVEGWLDRAARGHSR